MDTTPLPNQQSDMSDNGSVDTNELTNDGLVHYLVRLTPCEKYNFQDLVDFFKEEYQICRYVVGRELIPQEHFHAVLSVDESVLELQVRDIIKAFLHPKWGSKTTGRMPKGFGNKQYNLQECNDYKKSISYSVKLNEYVYEGWPEEFILECQAASYEKKKPNDFKHEYRELCDDFQSSNMDIGEFMIRFCQLKAKYGQQVVVSHAYGYANSNMIKRDPGFAEELVNNFLSKQ